MSAVSTRCSHNADSRESALCVLRFSARTPLLLLLLLLHLLALAGCSSLPTFIPALVPAGIVTLHGPHGILSEAKTKKILAGLESGDEAPGSFRRHLALEEAIVGRPLVSGNAVTLLQDGHATYPAMLTAIRAAKSSINMESYIIDDDAVGEEFSQALLERRRAGVEVNLLYDSFGAMRTPREFFKVLSDAGINVLEFNPINPSYLRQLWNVNERDHRKLLVVDGKIVFVGGINISSVYSSGSFRRPGTPRVAAKVPWRDTHVRMEGPVAAEFQMLFMTTWRTQKGPPLAQDRYFPPMENAGEDVVRAVGSTPDGKYSLIYAALLAAIANADTRIYLTNAYFVPDPRLLAALKRAARRGVDVRLMLPGTSDSKLVLAASRSFYAGLLRAGVKIYEHQDALLHAKTAVIDGVWSSIGSTNLDWRSLRHNQEIDAVILGPAFGDRMQALFAADMSSARLITAEQWQQRSVTARLRQFGARLWARLL